MAQPTHRAAPTAEPPAADAGSTGAGYAWYALVVLVLVYVLNFIDQIGRAHV